MVGPVLDADGVAVTGGVVGDFKISKNGASPGALDGSATLTHRHTGFYSLALTANDVDTVGTGQVTIDDTTNTCPMLNLQIIEEVIFDALFAASANAFAGAAGSTTLGAGAITATVVADATIDAATFAAGAINATAIASDAITDAKVAADVTIASVTGAVGSVTGAVGSVTGAVGSVTGNVGGNVTGSVGSVASGGILRASFAADTGLQTIRSNTAQAGAAGTITLDASASAVSQFYRYKEIYLTGGTGAGQVRQITSYNESTKVATVDANWATTPDNTTTFAILPHGTGTALATVTNIWTTAQTEAYRATNTNPTPIEILYEVLAFLTQHSKAGLVVTSKKIDGTTTAKTYTLDSVLRPIAITETT
jgi:hypothetical protein